MQGGAKPKAIQSGFTIVETVIVLAITAGLLVMAGAFISGRQASTEFSQGIQQVQAEIQQAMNDVSNGYYPNDGAITCTDGGTSPTLSDATTPQGSNRDCTFLGKLLQFGVSGDASTYNVYTIVGLSGLSGSSLDPATSLPAAGPRLLARSTAEDVSGSHVPEVIETHTLPFGLSVYNMYYGPAHTPPGHDTPTTAVLFLAGFQSLSAANNTSAQVDVAPFPGGRAVGYYSKDTMVDDANGVINGGADSISNLSPSLINQADGVHICLQSGASNQSALLSIGGAGRQSSVTLDIMDNKKCS